MSRSNSVKSVRALASQEGSANDQVAEAIYSFKLLESLRKGDRTTLLPFLVQGCPKECLKEITSPLHLAVRCADYQTIAFCLGFKNVDINAADIQQGNTALHIAAASGRDDVVDLLLDQKDIDDTKRNRDGRDALEAAKTPEIAHLIQVSRAKLNDTFLELLDSYEQGASDAEEKIFEMLDLPRSLAIDLNTFSANGSTLLHEAVKRKDARMIETAVRKGANVFIRDQRGKRVGDMTKDEKVKALLRQVTNADAARQSQGVPGHSPSFKGYMGKWTNIAGGYKTRWFVLENGILSYYHSQEDEGKQSRGAINMRYAHVRADNNDKHRFEIISEVGKGSSKLYLRGTHPVERARWVQVLQQTKEFFEMEPASNRTIYNLSAVSTSSLSTLASVPSNQIPPTPSLPSGLMSPPPAPSSSRSVNSSTSKSMLALTSLSGKSSDKSFPLANRSPSIRSKLSIDDRDDMDSVEESSVKTDGKPHEAEFSLVAESLTTQTEMNLKLVESLLGSSPSSSDSTSSGAGSSLKRRDSSKATFRSSVSSSDDIRSTLISAVRTTAQLVEKYQKMVADREAYMAKQYEREIQIKHLWEENMKVLAHQHAEMEASLKEAAEENARKRKALREYRGTLGSSPSSGTSPLPLQADMHSRAPSQQHAAGPDLSSPSSPSVAVKRENTNGSSLTLRLPDPVSSPILSPRPLLSQRRSFATTVDEELSSYRDSIDDAEDEFFDAIETGNLPGLKVEELREQPLIEYPGWPEHYDVGLTDEQSIGAYHHLRSEMPIGKDDRPSMSLWAILKNNIGKDLTKISFPVSFNEPTSMLQRMAEDMEFSECLDAATLQEDSTKRTAFVAAFAMSNYSSTIGRIAKPFNPMLGETFEYVRRDKKYRYYSEQVSHHPPISACYAQSYTWEYMGSVDAKSKFLGRTFEIRPTGVAHVNLSVSPAWVGTDKELKPSPASRKGDEKVLEHYSWNKVTTSVSGFIVGSPTIDHYGDMEVTNHATGDKCILTFKPRGWRGKDAFEIRGAVYDRHGNLCWDIAGRWNSQLVARKVGAGIGALNPDQHVDAPGGELVTAQPTAEHLLLWQNSEKHPTPFNLTPFAITLNSCPDDLRPWLAPTDCRLRPDLSAFESGKFDQANELKQALEDFQRETKKKRELGLVPPHKPRWFTKTIDADTKETFWQRCSEPDAVAVASTTNDVPSSSSSSSSITSTAAAAVAAFDRVSYWAERARVGHARLAGVQEAEWNDVYHIFGDFEVR